MSTHFLASKSADEGGQFFDHHWTPTPAVSADDGKSTVNLLLPAFAIVVHIQMSHSEILCADQHWIIQGIFDVHR
jgi:hypothetical protein